jgi:hypothetical protein
MTVSVSSFLRNDHPPCGMGTLRDSAARRSIPTSPAIRTSGLTLIRAWHLAVGNSSATAPEIPCQPDFAVTNTNFLKQLAPVAQWIEQRFPKPLAGRSIRLGGAQ